MGGWKHQTSSEEGLGWDAGWGQSIHGEGRWKEGHREEGHAHQVWVMSMEARRTPGDWGAETKGEVAKRKRVKHGAKRRAGARRKVRRGITRNGCARGLRESTLWAARVGARLWWVGNKWEVRDCRPFAQASLPRRLAVNRKHTVVAEGNQKCGEGTGWER